MAGKKISKAEIDARRLHVARLLTRRMAPAEILVALEKLGYETSVRTTTRDVAAVRQAWRDEAVAELDEHKAVELAELREMDRDAARGFASTHDPRFLAERTKIKTRIASLLGLDAATKHAGHDGGPLGPLEVTYVNDWRGRRADEAVDDGEEVGASDQ